MPRVRVALLAAAAAGVLAACSGGAAGGAPTWVPAPSFQGEGQQPHAIPNVPQPTQGSSSGSAPAGPNPSASTTTSDPSVVATHLNAPDGIAVLPDGSALVGERTTGRIVQVQPVPDQPVRTVRTLAVDSSGGGGLLDLALSPNYAQDSLVFAYLSTSTDNRVVDFTLTGPMTPVLTGIPRGTSDNVGRITFGADGRLYVGTGDAGQPSLAANTTSLAGKILRVTDIGRPAPDNPSTGSAVYTSGHREVVGLCADHTSGLLFDVEAPGGNGLSNVNVITAGANYGWPTATTGTKRPLAAMPKAFPSPGGCAVANNAYYATSLDGHALLAATLTVSNGVPAIGAFTAYLKNTYGRLLNVVAAPDGSLWLTTSNRDGRGTPVPADERVLHIQAPSPAGSNYPG